MMGSGSSTRTKHGLMIGALLSVALSGCSQVGVPVPSSGAPAGSGTATPSAPRSGGSTAEAIVELTNRERAKAGRPALARESRLMRAAQLHAEQMAAARRMEHVIQGAQYPTPEDRLVAVGYRFTATAENVSWNQPTASAAVEGWMRSAGHRTNMLSGSYTEMGAGYATNSAGQPYYVQVFGRPR